MALKYQEGAESITQGEHIGPNKTGDNIQAKRTANYIWDSDTSSWVRQTASAGGAGVAAYSDSGGTDRKGLVDADRHVQVDVLSSALPTGAATAANQQTDALTDTQLRATPVPVSGTVTATPTGTQNVDVTANTIGLATSANLTSGTQQTKLTDGTNTVAVGSLGDGDSSRQSLVVDARVKMYNGTSFDRIRGDTTNGLLVNLGANNDVTVTSGAITETNSAAIKTAVETIDNAISGSEMQVDVVGALPAGTNAIGKVGADSATGSTVPANAFYVGLQAGSGALAGLQGASLVGDGNAGNGTVAVHPVVYNGTTYDKLRGDATNGMLVNLGTNNDITGTVTANLSATDNAVLDAIEADTTTLAGAVSGSEVQVDVVGALPAGTNAIGKLAANSGVDIGDVDVTSSVSSTLDHGSNLDIDTTAEQITTTSFAAKFGVTVKAAVDNTDTVYIGNSDVTAGTTAATDGFPLEPGESITLPVNNSNLLYAIGAAANQKVFWSAV